MSDNKLKIALTGSVICSERLINYAYKKGHNNKYDFSDIFYTIKNRLKDMDMSFYVQESVLGGHKLGVSGYPRFNSPQSLGDNLIDVGFNNVILPTNHSLDYDEAGVFESIKFFNKRKDKTIGHGFYSSQLENNIAHIYKVNNISYAVLSYTYGTNLISMPKNMDYMFNIWPMDFESRDPKSDKQYQLYKEKVSNDIEKLRNKVDLLIVAIHWGEEYLHKASAYQKDCAEFLAGCGVDIVYGAHPHVIQPIEKINDTLVFYSHGNLLAHLAYQKEFNTYIGLFSYLDIEKDNNGKIQVINYDNELSYIYSDSDANEIFNTKIVFFRDKDIYTYLDKPKSFLIKYKQIIKSLDSSVVF